MPAPRPILTLCIVPQSPDDRDRMHPVLVESLRLDPLLEVRSLGGTAAVTLAGQSEAQLDAICARLRYEFHIDIKIGAPGVIYLETILKPSDAEGKYIRQTGGSGNYGHVKIRLEPQDPGTGFTFVNQIPSGVIPEQYFQSIEDGLRVGARCGAVAGYEIIDVKVTVFDGSYHKTDSNPMAFHYAATRAFQEAAKKADPIVIEPIMTTVFTSKENAMSNALAEISALRGRVEEIDTNQGMAAIRALVPLHAMLGYKGSAVHAMRFSHYALANYPPDSDAANASVRNPREPAPRPHRAAVDPDSDWT